MVDRDDKVMEVRSEMSHVRVMLEALRVDLMRLQKTEAEVGAEVRDRQIEAIIMLNRALFKLKSAEGLMFELDWDGRIDE